MLVSSPKSCYISSIHLAKSKRSSSFVTVASFVTAALVPVTHVEPPQRLPEANERRLDMGHRDKSGDDGEVRAFH
jgi:hypothetical protein